MIGTYYIIQNVDGTKTMDVDCRMCEPGVGRAAFSSFLKSSANQWIEMWKHNMRLQGLEPYELVIREVTACNS